MGEETEKAAANVNSCFGCIAITVILVVGWFVLGAILKACS